MKLQTEESHGNLIVSTEDDKFVLCIEIATGEIVNWLGNFDTLDCTIDELYRFVNKARSSYRKFMQSAEVESFKFD